MYVFMSSHNLTPVPCTCTGSPAMQDTQSHANLLGNVGAGMITEASTRRHALRAEAQKSFGKNAPPKPMVRMTCLAWCLSQYLPFYLIGTAFGQYSFGAGERHETFKGT